MFEYLHRLKVFLLFLTFASLTGCAKSSLDNWGSQVRIDPGWKKFKRASVNAAKDPGTWVPAAGAVLILASGRDEELTQEAIRDSWVYGTMNDALEFSNEHAMILDNMWMASMLATTSGEGDWLTNKAKGIVTESVIVSFSNVTTSLLKKAIRRREPYEGLDHVEYEAFPSHHSTPVFTRAALLRRNLRYTAVNDFSKYSLITVSYLLASSSAYGRVEGGLHHISDQLAGAALGNYIGLVLFDTFVEDESMWTMAIHPMRNYSGVMVKFGYSF